MTEQKDDAFSVDEIITMFPKDERELAALLIDAAQHEIHSDYEKAHGGYKTLLLHIEGNLVNPNLDIQTARAAARLNGVNTYATEFSRITGKKPRDYVESHKMKLAQTIRRHSKADNYVIAFAVGFKDQNLFSRNYKRVFGYPPSKEPRADQSETLALLEHLKAEKRQRPEETLDPRSPANAAEISSESPCSDMNVFWGDMADMGLAKMKAHLRGQLEEINLGHFHLLLDKSIHVGRIDRARGQELAHAALYALKLAELASGDYFPNETVEGAANLANMYRMGFDFPGSRLWFNVADRYLPNDPEEEPLLRAKVDFLKAYLLWWQRHTESALSMVYDALPVIRQHGSPELLARILLLAADIHDHSGSPGRAMPLFEEALELTPYLDDVYLIFAARFNLTLLHVRSENASDAELHFKVVEEMYRDVENQIVPYHVSYLGGGVCRLNKRLKEAEVLYLEAIEGFSNAGLDIYAALVALDLALLYLDLGDERQAYLKAVSAIPSVSRFGGHKEAISALSILQEAGRREKITKQELKKALRHLELVRKDPIAGSHPNREGKRDP